VSTINIVIVFDTQSIMQAAGSTPSQISSSPTPIAHEYIYMITQPGYVVPATSSTPTTLATANLNIMADTGDVLQWSACTLSGDSQTYVIPYSITAFSTTGSTEPTTVTGTPSPLLITEASPYPILPFPTSGNPTCTLQTLQNYLLQATVANYGTEQYSVSFMILEQQQNGNITTLGYYNWDPTITVSVPTIG
jgi:nematocidal protein AidA